MEQQLLDILTKTQEELYYYMWQKLNNIYGDEIIDGYGNYIYAKGDIPILLVAHLDIVHKNPPKLKDIFYDNSKKVIWCPTGIGGDDRMGIYGILKILEKGLKPYVLLTTDEEMGSVGADIFTQDYEKDYINFKFMIELDRRGNNQAVFYDCGNQEFIDYVINNFKFKQKEGSFTDISVLMPHFDIAGVNFSVGYYNEHTLQEYINLNHFNNTIRKVVKILQDENSKYYDAQYKENDRNNEYFNSIMKDIYGDDFEKYLYDEDGRYF